MRTFALAAAATLALAAPFQAQDTTEQQAEYDAGTVMATVNGTEITLGHMIALLDQLPDQVKAMPDAQIFDGILEQLINQTLLGQSVSDDPANDSRHLRLILENERISRLSASAVETIVAEEIPEDELEEARQARIADFEPTEEFNASHILVETADEAMAVISELDDGADFAELAKEKSTGPSGPNGGQLGWFGRGQMVPPFEAAVVELEAGAISDPVQTQFGFHVIKLNDTRMTEPPSLEDMRGDLTQEITRGRITAELARLREAGSVEVQAADIPKDAIRKTDMLSE